MDSRSHTILMTMTAATDWPRGLATYLSIRRDSIRQELETASGPRVKQLQGALQELTELEGLRAKLEATRPT